MLFGLLNISGASGSPRTKGFEDRCGTGPRAMFALSLDVPADTQGETRKCGCGPGRARDSTHRKQACTRVTRVTDSPSGEQIETPHDYYCFIV